jgi:hypothetical protein
VVAACPTIQQRANLYEVGWPDAPHRALHNSTAERWQAAGRPPPGSRPGEGQVIAHFASGEPILRYSPAPPMLGTTGEIEALSLWAGQSVALAKQPQHAAEIVAELVSRLCACSPFQVKASPRRVTLSPTRRPRQPWAKRTGAA